MLKIEKKYIVDENNNKLAVEIDISTFNKIEDILENYALYNFMKESEDTESLSISEAREYYDTLLKKNGN
jgi:hypothetical protein